MSTPASAQDRIAAWKRKWNESTFLKAQGLEVEETGVGRVTVRLPQVQPSQLGGGGTDNELNSGVLNGGVISYMFDGALGWAIMSALMDLPEAKEINPSDLRQFTINLDITFLDAAIGSRFEAHGRIVRVSKSTAFAEGDFVDANGKVCATAKGIWRIFWPRNKLATAS